MRADGATASCAGCWSAIREVRATGGEHRCETCGETYAPSEHTSAPIPARERITGPVEPREGLLALALELPRLTGHAMPLEPERAPDAEERAELFLRSRMDPLRRELRRERRITLALAALRRISQLVDADRGDVVAKLWGFWGVVSPVCDASGTPDYGPADLNRRLDALALGCAPGPVRETWRALAKRRRTVHDLSRRLPRRERSEWNPRTMEFDRVEVGGEPRVVHTITTGEDPVPLEVSAAAWGRELLAPLWPQARVPPADLARRLALGWATSAERGGWDAIGTRVIRDSERRAWAQRLADAAAEAWRDDGGHA